MYLCGVIKTNSEWICPVFVGGDTPFFPVNKDLIPSFIEIDRTPMHIIHQNIYFIILFLGEILLLFVLSQFIFNKTDVR